MSAAHKTDFCSFRCAFLLSAAALITCCIQAAAGAVAHPLLFVTPQKIAAIQKQIQQKGTHHFQAYTAMKNRVDRGNASRYGNPRKYARTYLAREAAFLSLISPDKSERQKYATLAFDTIEQMYTDKKHERFPHSGYGLSRAMMGLGIGIPYDWCYQLWSGEQRAFVEEKIQQALDAWPSYGHANLGDVKGSNWVAVCRGGELILLLAAGDEKKREKRYRRLKRDLTRHMHNGFGTLGVTQEGAGYTEYPGSFLLPAAYAAESIGDTDLLETAQNKNWWKLALYTHSFQPHSRKFVQTGVAHSSNYDEGWASLILHLAPEAHLPSLVWWYDRHMGVRAPGGLQDKFDSARAGTTWSLIYYPGGVEARDPTGTYPHLAYDRRGYFFFRNRWKDENDILASITSDTHHHGHAWDQPEQLAINLMAFNTRFIGGPGKGRDAKFYSSLLIDGKYNFKKATRLTGETVDVTPDEDGGCVIVSGGQLYRQLGVEKAVRHMLVRFSRQANSAVIATCDTVESRNEHAYTWQANLGSDRGDDNVRSTAGKENNVPFFLLKGRNGGFVKGWVVTPEQVTITTGDPLGISTRGKDATIVVVMFVGSGTVPRGKLTKINGERALSVAGITVWFDSSANRLSSRGG